MWYLKKIIAWLLVFAILIFSLCVPVFATDPAPTDSRGDFYDWLVNSGALDKDRPGGPFAGGQLGGGRPTKDDYDTWVSTLPAPGYNSAGRLIWQPTVLSFSSAYSNAFHSSSSASALFSSFPLEAGALLCVFNDVGNGFTVKYTDYFVYADIDVAFNIPVAGSYRMIDSIGISFEGIRKNGSVFSYSRNYFPGSFSHFSSTITVCEPFDTYISSEPVSYGFLNFYFPVFEVVPDTALSGDTYNINTRPTTITGGNYGIVGDDNNITTVTNTTQIVNEGDNLYYNPATGQTKTITDWTYNYDNRIYDITLDTGDKVSVEYGDENITITENNVVEGDTIVNNYTIYYMIDGSGSEDNPSPTLCPHDWQAGTSTAPTCTAPGKTSYTCSKCGETKTDTVPALGHDWEVVRTVPTEYDESGIQTQAGYTLYECTRCGEQYKDTDSTGPPGDDASEDGGLIAWLNGLVKSLSDNLSGVVELILRFFTEIPALFSGFTAFLAAVFPFLPDEIMLLLTFGMAALVVVGVIKAIRR